MEEEKSTQPTKLTFAQNAILTVKVLAIAAGIMLALWGAKLWTSPR